MTTCSLITVIGHIHITGEDEGVIRTQVINYLMLSGPMYIVYCSHADLEFIGINALRPFINYVTLRQHGLTLDISRRLTYRVAIKERYNVERNCDSP